MHSLQQVERSAITGEWFIVRRPYGSPLTAAISSPRVVAICLLVGVAVRLALIVLVPVEPTSDAAWYFRRARDIAAGLGYQEKGYPTAFWPVGYPAFLAGLFELSRPSVLVGQLANIGLWIVTILLLHATVKKIAKSVVAANAAIILYSLHLNSLGYAPLLLTETLYTFLLIATLWITGRHDRMATSVVLGLVFGLMTLVKAQTWLSLVGWLVVSVMLAGNAWRQTLLKRTLTLAVCFAVVLPWSLRNLHVFGQFVLVSTNGGISFAVGNHPNSRGGDDWQGSPYRSYIAKSVEDQVAADQRAKEVTWKWIRENPLDFAALAPIKLFRALVPDGESEWSYQRGYRNYERYRYTFRTMRWLNQIYYAGILCVALGCLVYLLRQFGSLDAPTRAALLLSLGFIGAFLALTVVFNGQSRYHFPFVPMMIIWIAVGWTIRRTRPRIGRPNVISSE